MTAVELPHQLRVAVRGVPGSEAWLASLGGLIPATLDRWALTLLRSRPARAAVVLDVQRADGSDAVLKFGLPHMEARDEIEGLRFWNGEPTVELLDADLTSNTMLLELCRPGTPLSSRPVHEQDTVIADLLKRLWKRPPSPGFRPLSRMIEYWTREAEREGGGADDRGLLREGVEVLRALASDSERSALLATDLHAGNVLQSEREPWLVIDPKPFVGDPAYDLTQHLLNGRTRLLADPIDTIERLSERAGVDAERVRLWAFGCAAASPFDDHADWDALARRLAPA